MSHNGEIRLPAIEIDQGANKKLYNFGVDGKLVPRFATISRIRRDEENQLDGYQRPEVMSHIGEIRHYLETDAPMIPNSLVIAFDSRVRFEAHPDQGDQASYSRPGTLVIPVDDTLSDEQKPGWIVDGQQRVAAIRDARVDQFPISVVAFVTEDVKEQREQFILVNSTKPLPKGLIYELLPGTDARLATLLERRRFPAQLLQRLNLDDESPLRGLIKTPTNSQGLIRDNSILKMLENSLFDGALYRFRDPTTGRGDEESMLALVKNFWGAASHVFEKAWALSPRRSRLMHGAGVVSMGFVMDAIADRNFSSEIPSEEAFRDDLEPLKEVCRWTAGYWDFGPGVQRKWNEIQNIPRDIQMLANYLLIEYKARVWNREPASL